MVTSRYKNPAYENLQFYKNICEIRRIICKITKGFKNIHMRLISQMRDAARSAKQNIREGYSKDTDREFAHSILISKGSISELEGDLDDCREDGLIERIDSYIDSLYRLEKAGKWKTRFKRNS